MMNSKEKEMYINVCDFVFREKKDLCNLSIVSQNSLEQDIILRGFKAL